MDLHEGAYDRSGSINVKGNGAYLTLNDTIGDFHAHFGHLVPDGRFQESGRWRWLHPKSLHARFLRQDEGVLAGPAPDEQLRRAVSTSSAASTIFTTKWIPPTTARFGDVLRGAAAVRRAADDLRADAHVDGGLRGWHLLDSRPEAEIYLGVRETQEKGDIDNFVAGGAGAHFGGVQGDRAFGSRGHALSRQQRLDALWPVFAGLSQQRAQWQRRLRLGAQRREAGVPELLRAGHEVPVARPTPHLQYGAVLLQLLESAVPRAGDRRQSVPGLGESDRHGAAQRGEGAHLRHRGGDPGARDAGFHRDGRDLACSTRSTRIWSLADTINGGMRRSVRQ